jgi:hypothetical protein
VPPTRHPELVELRLALTGMPLQECIDRIEEDLSVGHVTIDFDQENDCLRLVPAPTAFKKP